MRLLAVLLLCGGCFAGIPVRTADTVPRGETRVMLDITLGGYAPGAVHSSGGETTGNAIWKWKPIMEILVTVFHIVGADVTVSTGMNDDCEVGGRVSFHRVGGEVRCGAQRGDTAVAGSVELAVPWLIGTFPVDHAWLKLDPWLRVGVEASTRDGGDAAIAGLHLSWGTENYALEVPEEPAFSGPGAFALAQRRELRLSGVLGGGLVDDEHARMLLGVVPFVVLHTGAARLECSSCRGTYVDDFRLNRGFTAVVGLSAF